MVTVEKYISAFVRIVPQRAAKLRLLTARKEIIDSKILRDGTLDSRTARELLIILGDEKTSESIRGALWKIQKSLSFFLSKRGRLIDQIYEESNKISNKRGANNEDIGMRYYSDMINLRGNVESIVSQLLPLIDKLCYTYKSEAGIIARYTEQQVPNNAYVGTYNKLLQEEKGQSAAVKNSSKMIIQFQRNLQGFIAKMLNSENTEVLTGIAVSVVGLTLFASILALPSMMYGIEVVKDATPLIPKLLGLAGGTIGSMTSLSTFCKFLGESI
ncbi:hypothetical protein HY483_02190 [Candidatus Woesearchaeota archaeon]|nr:hypothetical protein [Candidatus Woesearchaeota archaeon]